VAGNAGNRRGCIQLVKRKSLPWCFGTMESDEVHDDSPMGWSEGRLLVRGLVYAMRNLTHCVKRVKGPADLASRGSDQGLRLFNRAPGW
jgi:hypothetical protein